MFYFLGRYLALVLMFLNLFDAYTLGPFIRGKIRRVLNWLELYHLYEHVLSNKTRLNLDEMCRLYGTFASYFSLHKWPYCQKSG